MKTIMISIRPEWVAKILNKEKTIEARKTAPKCDLPIEVYIYCTKPNDRLFALGKMFDDRIGKIAYFVDKKCNIEKCTDTGEVLNGKVVAKFTLREVEIFDDFDDELCDRACLDRGQILDYLGTKLGYAWHISDLVIFDRPKELSEFKRIIMVNKTEGYESIYTKAPQSWGYCEEKR